MKITKQQLRTIIKEELQTINEAGYGDDILRHPANLGHDMVKPLAQLHEFVEGMTDWPKAVCDAIGCDKLSLQRLVKELYDIKAELHKHE